MQDKSRLCKLCGEKPEWEYHASNASIHVHFPTCSARSIKPSGNLVLQSSVMRFKPPPDSRNPNQSILSQNSKPFEKKQWCFYMFLLFVYYIMWYFFLFYWEPCGGVLFHVLNSFSKLFVGLLSRACLWNFQLRCLGHSSTWFQARWAHGSHTCGTPRRERFNSDKFWWRYRPRIKRTTFLDANRNQTRN